MGIKPRLFAKIILSKPVLFMVIFDSGDTIRDRPILMNVSPGDEYCVWRMLAMEV